MAARKKLRLVFIIEGGRSRTDVAAITKVATEAERAGAHVTVLRHGLGRLAGAGVRRQIREERPDVVVTTGATSTRDAEKLGRARGFAVVCYYWPAGPIEDIHRRPRHRGKAPKRTVKISVPTHAVLGSALHQEVLQRYLGSPHKSVEVHILPPLVDENVAADGSAATAEDSAPRIGVYGGHTRELPASDCEFVDLDVVVAGAGAEASRVADCHAILILSCGTAEEREAPRRCATALCLGKPVLASGFGDGGGEAPLQLAAAPVTAHGCLRVAAKEELPAALRRLLADLPSLPRSVSPVVKEALSPQNILTQHTSLLLRIAQERHAAMPVRKDTVATRLLTRLRTLLRRRES